MDSGEVAVEASRAVPTFGDLSTSHLKERYFGGTSHRPHPSSQPVMYQGTTCSSTTYHQPPVYHRYQSNYGTHGTPVSSMTNGYGQYTYQYPSHNHGRRGPKYHQQYGGQINAPTATPTTTNQATQTIPAVNMGPTFRSKHSRHHPCSIFFSRGHCHYGANCRFSHDVNSSRTRRFVNKTQSSPDAPLSAPALLTTIDRHNWSNAVNKTLNHDELNSHDDEQFPQLRGKTRGHSISSNQSPEKSHKATSPFKKMVFRDAVLKQKSDDDGDGSLACSSPTKSSLNSDGDSSESTEEDTSNSKSPSPHGGSTFPQRFPHRSGYGRIHPTMDSRYQSTGELTDNFPRYTRQMPRSTDNNYFYRGNHLRYPTTTTSVLPQAQPLVHSPLESEHVAYGAPPDYSTLGFGSGVDIGYSLLSVQADQYVDKLDAQLSALEQLHQTAIASLQEVARNVWQDAVFDIYGSNYTRLALPKSDVDCVLVSQAATSEEPSSVLWRLSEELKQQEWVIRVDLLDSAKIPVLKIVYGSGSSDGIEVMLDVTCNHSTGHSGLSAREIIYSYQTDMPALRPLVLILKSHIQNYGLNCAFTGGLSSYAIVLLAIRFLQACGDEHHRSYDTATFPSQTWRGRSYSESGVDTVNNVVDGLETSSTWVYVFTRDGKVMWRTGLGNLLLLFLETYITFDYRHYGISIENTGEYFALPAEKVTVEPGAVVVPYIVDPIKPNRGIGNCFRMHEIIQAWYILYQSIASGVPLEDALHTPIRPIGPV